MRVQWVVVLVVTGLLVALAGPAGAQIPGTEQLIETPKITIGKARTTTEKVSRILGELEEREKTLIKTQPDLIRWKDDLQEANERLEQLEALRESVLKGQAAAAQDSLDPELLPQVEQSIDLHNELADTISFIIETFKQEQNEVTAGLKHARRLLKSLETPPPPMSVEDRLLLDEVLQYLADLRLSRISLSLLKARRAGLNEELDQSLKEKKREFKLQPLTEFAGDPESRRLTLELRQEVTQRVPILRSYRKAQRKRVAGHIEAQLQRVRLEIYEREEELDQLENRRPEIYAALAVSQDDLAAAQERLETARKRIADAEREIRRELKELRLNPPEDDQPGSFTPFKAWQTRVTVLQHRLYLHDVEEQVETFRAAALAALHNLIRLRPPPPEFRENFAWYFDAERQARARAELDKRREAWRQEYARLSMEEPEAENKATAAQVLEGYQEILDLYDLIDARKWEIEWCAQLVRHYQEQYELSQRDTFWYVWRVGLSVALVLLGLAVSVLAGRWSLRPLRKRPEAPNWLRYTLFLTFIAVLLAVWTTLLVGTLTLVWGALFGFEDIGAVFSKVLFSIGDREITLYAFAGLLGVIALTVLVSRLTMRFLRGQIFPYFNWDLGVQHAVSAVVKYLVLFTGFALGLEFVGIGFGALALFAGVIGIGIGFGLQAIANNFISGITLLFERPIKKGDFVDAGGLEGRVEEIRARATTLVTRDSVSVIVPNSEFISGRVVNWSHGSDNVRLHIPVGVAYGSDVALVTKLLKKVADKHASVLDLPEPEVWFREFGESSLNFELLIWTNEVERKYHITSDLNYAIDQSFREHGVTIPFPQRDVHVKEK